MRKVERTDAPELARLIGTIWPDHNASPKRIARVSLDSSHVTLVETRGKRLVGFVDAFVTPAQNGTLRWEIDLLGVHPDERGRGIAQKLVRASVEAGKHFGAEYARALVKVDNTASLNTFQRCGFSSETAVYHLCVSDQAVHEQISVPPGAFLISVNTLTYGGVWIEGDHSAESLRSGQAARTRYGWDVAGAVVSELKPAIAHLGFEVAGSYHWLYTFLNG